MPPRCSIPGRDGLHAAAPRPTLDEPCSPGSAAPLRRRLGVRRPLGRARRAPVTAGAVAVGDDGSLLVRGDDGVLRGVLQHLPPPRPRAAAVRARPTARRSIQCPYHGWTLRPRRLAAVDAPLRRAATASTGADVRPRSPVAVEEWHGWVLVNVVGRRRRRWPSTRRARRRSSPATSASASWSAATPHLRAGGQLEAARRELPRVLPLPAHPPRALRGQPAGRAATTATITTGMWIGGWHGAGRRRRDDVARRPRGGAMLRGLDELGSAESTTSGCCPTCWSACTPTT